MKVSRGDSILFLSLCSILLHGQQTGRFATLKSQAFTLFERGQYEQVAGKLEEVWEQDQSDPKVAEYLAIGYLYGERDLNKARPVMKAAIERGGQATFLVQHSHERSGILGGGPLNNYCTGKMSVVPGKLTFTADSGEHSATFTAADIKDFHILGGSPGRVQFKALGKNYVFRGKTEKNDEAEFLEELVTANVKRK